MEVKVFVKEDCPRCPAAKRACEGVQNVQVYDVTSIEGLAEASFYNVLDIPSVLVLDSAGNEIAAWRGEAPDARAIHALMAN
jgi:glutaredoxin